jgi:hypothetical protein
MFCLLVFPISTIQLLLLTSIVLKTKDKQEKKRRRYCYADDHVKFISQKKTYHFFYMYSDFCERKKGQLKTNNACFKSIVWFWSILFVNDLFHFFLEILYHTKSRKQN